MELLDANQRMISSQKGSLTEDTNLGVCATLTGVSVQSVCNSGEVAFLHVVQNQTTLHRRNMLLMDINVTGTSRKRFTLDSMVRTTSPKIGFEARDSTMARYRA